MATTIETHKAVEAKGKNGYFKVDRITVQEHPSGEPEVSVHFLSNRSNYPGSCWVTIPAEYAVALGNALVETAVLARGYF